MRLHRVLNWVEVALWVRLHIHDLVGQTVLGLNELVLVSSLLVHYTLHLSIDLLGFALLNKNVAVMGLK